MKTITLTREIYRYEELGDAAKDMLRDEYRRKSADKDLYHVVWETWPSRLLLLGYKEIDLFWDVTGGQGECTVFQADVDLTIIVKRMGESEKLAYELEQNWWYGSVHCDLTQTRMWFTWESNSLYDLAHDLKIPYETLESLTDRVADFVRSDVYVQAKAIHQWIEESWDSITDNDRIDDAYAEGEGWYFEDGTEFDEDVEDDDDE